MGFSPTSLRCSGILSLFSSVLSLCFFLASLSAFCLAGHLTDFAWWFPLQFRSGHGHFADYYERFGHDEKDLHCQCGKKRDRLHPFSCPKARPQRGILLCKKLGRQLSPKEVLGTPERVKVFAEWSLAMKLFGRNRIGGHKRKVRLGKARKTRPSLLVSLFFF